MQLRLAEDLVVGLDEFEREWNKFVEAMGEVIAQREPMWGILNQNAPAIQALAAVATLAVTGVLAWITWKYVQLTRRLAEVAAEQLKFQQEATRAKWHELWSYYKLLNRSLSELPDETKRGSFDRQIRGAFLWDQADLVRFQSLAAPLGTVPGGNAAVVVSSMAWLSDRIKEGQAVPKERGVDYERGFPLARWFEELKRARDGLRDVAEGVKPKLADSA